MLKATKSREFVPALQITATEIRAAVQADMERRRKFLERDKIIKDDLKPVVDAILANMFDRDSYEDMKPYIDVSNNFMRRVINETSILYKDEHERTVKPASGQKRYEEIIGDEAPGISLNQRMAKYNFNLNALNDLIIKIEGSNGAIDLTMLAPHEVTIFQNPVSPYMIDALLIEDSFTDQDGRLQQRWIFWSPLRHFILDSEFKIIAVPGNEGLLNPYWSTNLQNECFYPFIGLHATLRENSFWDSKTGTDLMEATKSIAIKNTFLYFMFPMQFKQIGAVGNFGDKDEFKNRQIKSPMHILKTNQELEVLDWQSKLLELNESVQNSLFSVASNYGISAENFKLTAVETSGFARMISKERLLEIRKQQIPTWRNAEVEMFDGIREAINLYDNLGDSLPKGGKLSIDYKEPEFQDDPMKELSLQERKINMGLTNPLQVIMEENPDIKTEEQAEEFLARNIEIRNRINSRFQLKPLTFDEGGQGDQNV